VDGYGTPAFVTQDAAGGGPVLDVGTYVVGQLLYLLGNADVERVGGQTFEYTDDAYAPEMVGDNRDTYADRLDESGYDVEDAGVGTAHLADGSVLELRSAWHMFLPDRPSVVAGSQGGVQLDPFEFYTTTEDYEATVDLDVDNYERRQALLESESGYGGDREDGQFAHWIRTLQGDAENPIPTGDIALNSMRVLEGIYRSAAEGREFTADEIAEQSESSAVEL
jgi:predicted dehydrogenase